MSLPLNHIYWIDFMSTLPERIADWTQTYCESLEENYKQYHIRSMETFTSDYAKQQLEDVKNGTANLMRFVIKTGRKYHKINVKNGGVHAFVDKQTGQVYKPASWKSPAKHVRYDLRLIKDREYLCANADWAGGYLYIRG